MIHQTAQTSVSRCSSVDVDLSYRSFYHVGTCYMVKNIRILKTGFEQGLKTLPKKLEQSRNIF